jgi:hypothetical protein
MTASAGSVTKNFTLQLNAAILALTINATSVAFGDVPVNTPATQSVTLTSTGTVPVTINGSTLTGVGFTLSGPTFPTTLNPNQDATLNIEFDPTVVGAATGQLTITSNSSTNNTVAIGLSGTGTAPTGATTYYVDNCVTVGNDANNGTSTSTPWLTIAHANVHRYHAGDSILFQRTCTWREELVPPSSGSSGSPITFGAYGTGTAPIIDGSDLLSVSWTPVSGNLWRATLGTQPLIAFFDGVPGTKVGSEANITAPGDWWWNADTLYVYSTSNPSSAFTDPGIEAGARQYAVIQYQVQYLSFSNLHLTKANYYGIQLTANVTVDDITADYNGTSGILAWESPDAIGNGITVENSTIAYNGGSGLNYGYVNNMLIQGNDVHHNCWNPSNAYSRGLDGGALGTTNVTVQYNNVHENGNAQTGSPGAGITCDTCGSGIVFRYNASWGNNGRGISLDADNNAQVYYNVAWNNAVGGISVFADANTSMKGHQIYNNTLYGNSMFGMLVEGPTAGSALGGCTNNTITNNIVVDTAGGPNLEAFNGCENPGADGSGNVYTHNDFGLAASNFIEWGAETYYSGYTPWETAPGNCGTPGCSHSVQANPQFVDAAAVQFWLASGSPAIGTGLNLGSPYNIGILPESNWPSSVVTGDQNAYGGGWEIGAFIYVPVASPTNAKAVVR